jgi:hypothetical protein
MCDQRLFENLAVSTQQSAIRPVLGFWYLVLGEAVRPTADQCVGRGLQEQKDRQNDTDSTGKNDKKRASTAFRQSFRIAL